MVSTAGTAVSVFPEWRFPNAGLRGHGGRNIQIISPNLSNKFKISPRSVSCEGLYFFV